MLYCDIYICVVKIFVIIQTCTPAHVSLDALLEMVVRTSSRVAPFLFKYSTGFAHNITYILLACVYHGPPDGEEEKVETISRQAIVVSD